MNITPEILARCTGASLPRAVMWAAQIAWGMSLYSIDTPVRAAAFLANVGHESWNLRASTEQWGPTDAQKRYEGRKDLGNIFPGDGARFRGHGLIQTTGRANHAAARDRLRARFATIDVPDFEAEPERLAEPRWAALSACDYWDMRKLNVYADAGDFDGVCDVINRGRKTLPVGDANGYADRFKLWVAAKGALGVT